MYPTTGPGDGRSDFWLLITMMSEALTLFSVLHTLPHDIHQISYQYWYFSPLSHTATPVLPFHGVLTPMPDWYWYNTNLQSLYLHDAAKLSFLICNKNQIPFNDL